MARLSNNVCYRARVLRAGDCAHLLGEQDFGLVFEGAVEGIGARHAALWRGSQRGCFGVGVLRKNALAAEVSKSRITSAK